VLAVTDAPDFAGAERYLLTLATVARDRGRAAVAVALPAGHPEVAAPFTAAGIEVLAVAGLRRRPATGPVRALRGLLRERPFTGLLVNLTDQGDNRAALAAAALTRSVPSVAVLHLWVPARPRWRRPAYAAALRAAGALVTPGDGTAADVRRLGLAPTVIRNGLSVPRLVSRAEARAELGLAADGVFIGGIGRLEPQKGWDLLADALPLLAARHPAARAVVVGDGPQRDELVRRGLLVPGGRPDAARLLRAFDVVAVPSRYESHALVPIEAALAGVACVLADIPGVRESASPVSRLVPPGDPAALAAGLAAVLDDPVAAEALARSAAPAAAHRHDPVRMVEATLDLLLRAGPGPAGPGSAR
jgi:glycosyltransferase involved in cell wall biosynthesis